MKRSYFKLSIIMVFILGWVLMNYEVRGYGLIVMLLTTLVAILRRSYLNIKPWWGGSLIEVKRYFTEP